MTAPLPAVVIGGGITGLCTGFYLARALGPEKVMVLEAAAEPGGTARSEINDGYVCELGPNGFLDKEPKTLQWIEDLGLSERLLRADAAAARRFLFRNGQLHEIKAPPGFLKSPLLSLRGRARLLAEPLVPAKKDESPESIWDFAARRIGREAADMLVAPMVSGIFGGNAKQLSLEHCFPRMAAMEREHGGLYKALRAKRKQAPSASPMGPGGTLTCFPEGMGALAQAAAHALGDRLRLNAAVAEVSSSGSSLPSSARMTNRTDTTNTTDTPIPQFFKLSLASGETIKAEHLIFAAPAYTATSIFAAMDSELSNALSSIPYAGITVLCTGYSRAQVAHDLNGFGFLIPRTEGLRALGCLWSSSIFPAHAPAGKVLLRTMYGGATDPGAVSLSDDALLDLFRAEIAPMLGVSGAPELLRIYRWERGIPQYDLEHGVRLAAIEAAEQRHPGLQFAGNAYRGVGLNDCVLSAVAAVTRLVESAHSREAHTSG